MWHRAQTEADGRMFPVTDNSSTIVNCLLSSSFCRSRNRDGNESQKLIPIDTGQIRIRIEDKEDCIVDAVLIATGGNASFVGIHMVKRIGTSHSYAGAISVYFQYTLSSDYRLDGTKCFRCPCKIAGTKFFSKDPADYTLGNEWSGCIKT